MLKNKYCAALQDSSQERFHLPCVERVRVSIYYVCGIPNVGLFSGSFCHYIDLIKGGLRALDRINEEPIEPYRTCAGYRIIDVFTISVNFIRE